MIALAGVALGFFLGNLRRFSSEDVEEAKEQAYEEGSDIGYTDGREHGLADAREGMH